jgi:hypothetical protein
MHINCQIVTQKFTVYIFIMKTKEFLQYLQDTFLNFVKMLIKKCKQAIKTLVLKGFKNK